VRDTELKVPLLDAWPGCAPSRWLAGWELAALLCSFEHHERWLSAQTPVA
jgi:hypothetical protein